MGEGLVSADELRALAEGLAQHIWMSAGRSRRSSARGPSSKMPISLLASRDLRNSSSAPLSALEVRDARARSHSPTGWRGWARICFIRPMSAAGPAAAVGWARGI